MGIISKNRHNSIKKGYFGSKKSDFYKKSLFFVFFDIYFRGLYIYSSDLARASDTAKKIAKYHPSTPIEFTTQLRERNLGEFQGKKKSELGYDLNKFLGTSLEIKEGESMKQLYERTESFLKSIISKHHKDTILFVGHNGINLTLIANIIGKNYDEIDTMEKQHNTSINIFEIDENRNHRIYVFNCIKHLD